MNFIRTAAAATAVLSLVAPVSALDVAAALEGTWTYDETFTDGEPPRKSVLTRQIHFERLGGKVYKTHWFHRMDRELVGGRIDKLRMGGVTEEQFELLDNDSLSLLTRSEYVNISPDPGIVDLDGWTLAYPHAPKNNRKVENGERTGLFGDADAHLEVIVFLDEDTFLLVKKEKRFTTVKKYRRTNNKNDNRDGAGKPTTHAESDSKGGDRPQPRSKGRSQ